MLTLNTSKLESPFNGIRRWNLSYLNTGLGQINLHGNFLPCVYIRIMCFLKGSFQFFKLCGCKRRTNSTLLSLLCQTTKTSYIMCRVTWVVMMTRVNLVWKSSCNVYNIVINTYSFPTVAQEDSYTLLRWPRFALLTKLIFITFNNKYFTRNISYFRYLEMMHF